MPTNKFFNNFYFQPEQELLESLVDEACNMYGMDIMYIPRNLTNLDQLYLTDDQSTYSMAIPSVIYMQNVEGFIGEQNIFSKFSLLIRNSIDVVMSKWEWKREILPKVEDMRNTSTTTFERPQEGDLIYFPLNNACFQIKFVNNKEIFYPVGSLPSFQMSCELFQYSDETFSTGIPDIDRIQKQSSLNAFDYSLSQDQSNDVLVTETGDIITEEGYDTHNIIPTEDSDDLNVAANTLVDYTRSNPFGSIPTGNN